MSAPERTSSWLGQAWERLVAVDVPDEEKARLGRLFNTLMLISIGIVLAVAATFTLAYGLGMRAFPLWLAVAFPLAFVPFSVFCLVQSKRGYTLAMIRLYVWVNFVGVALAILLFDGPRSPAWYLFAWTITIAGTLLTPGHALGMTAALVAYFLTLLLLDGLGLYTAPFTMGPEGRQFTYLGLGLIMLVSTVGLLTYLNMRGLRETLDRLRATTEELEQHRATLERQVADRTRDLAERATLLTIAADVGRVAASILEIGPLAHQVVDLIRERFDFYYVGLFLLDGMGAYAVLEAGTGEAGRLMEEQGYKLRVGDRSLVGTACARKEVRVALDVDQATAPAADPASPRTLSEIALPLIVGDRVLGALDVQSTQSAQLSQERIAVLRLVADQVAVAVDNARKFSEEAAVLEATSPIFRLSRRLATATTAVEVAQAIVDSVAETEADRCAVARFGFSPEGEVASMTFLVSWGREGDPHFPVGRPLPVSLSLFPLPIILQELWIVEDIRRDPRVPERAQQVLAQDGALAMVSIPLRAGDRSIGFISVGRAAAGPWSPMAIQLYTTLAEQAAIALERTYLLEETQHRVELERSIRALSDRVAASFTFDTILQTALDGLGSIVKAGGGVIELTVGEEETR